jgi:hypothetical protein
MDDRMAVDQPEEVVRRHPAHAAGRQAAHAHRHDRPGEQGDRRHPGRRPVAVDLLGAAVVGAQRLDLAVEDQQQARRVPALLGEHHRRVLLGDRRRLRPAPQLRAIEAREEVDPAEIRARRRHRPAVTP